MRFLETPIEGAFLITPEVKNDRRGTFTKHFSSSAFFAEGLGMTVAEVFSSVSRKDVVRGMHLQGGAGGQEKILTVARGKILDVLLDLRPSSGSYLEVFSTYLSEFDHTALFIPPGVAHGFLSETSGTKTLYMVSQEFDPMSDFGVRYDSFGFVWPVDCPIVSRRDASLPSVENFEWIA